MASLEAERVEQLACGTAQRRYVSVHKGTPPVDYRPVETDGAARAAGLLAELL